jgi:hypothetical protein
MLQTVEAIIDQQGKLKFLENVQWNTNQRVLVTFLQPDASVCNGAQQYIQIMQKLSYVQAGKSFGRDELNER